MNGPERIKEFLETPTKADTPEWMSCLGVVCMGIATCVVTVAGFAVFGACIGACRYMAGF